MMRICLICVEIFAWGKHGGFGRATRLIGRELVKRGHEVFAVVPRRAGQKSVENLDGIQVLSFNPYKPWTARKLFSQCNADIYHSCEPSFGTYLAMTAMPKRKHMVTFRDPRNLKDWIMEFQLPSLNRLQVIHNCLYENNYLVRRSIKKMDAVYTIAPELVPKVKRMYHPKVNPQFLPTPVSVPETITKAEKPTVCYSNRLDRRKRPMLFFELAKEFPDVEFIVMGKSRDKKWEAALRNKYEQLPNLKILGFVDQFSSNLHSEILEKSWVMVNCAIREAMPNAIIEAAAHQCAILSSGNYGGFASIFGYHAKDDDFRAGLRDLLKNGKWKECGQRGCDYIKEVFELDRVIDQHIEIYAKLLNVTENIGEADIPID